MTQKEFDAVLNKPETVGAWTFFVIPFNVEETFGLKNHVKVKGSINGVEFRTSLAPRGDGSHYMVVSKTIREAAGINFGEPFHVVMEPDMEERVVEVPDLFRKIFEEHEEEGLVFEKLSYTRRKDFVDFVMDAKKDSTREKRIAQMLEEIRKLGRKRKYH